MWVENCKWLVTIWLFSFDNSCGYSTASWFFYLLYLRMSSASYCSSCRRCRLGGFLIGQRFFLLLIFSVIGMWSRFLNGFVAQIPWSFRGYFEAEAVVLLEQFLIRLHECPNARDAFVTSRRIIVLMAIMLSMSRSLLFPMSGYCHWRECSAGGRCEWIFCSS